jgi:hypothetical protein
VAADSDSCVVCFYPAEIDLCFSSAEPIASSQRCTPLEVGTHSTQLHLQHDLVNQIQAAIFASSQVKRHRSRSWKTRNIVSLRYFRIKYRTRLTSSDDLYTPLGFLYIRFVFFSRDPVISWFGLYFLLPFGDCACVLRSCGSTEFHSAWVTSGVYEA